MPLLLESMRVTAISRLSTIAAWDRSEVATAVYNPPPGWVILQIETVEHSSNNGSHEVSVIGGGLSLVTEQIVAEAYDAAIKFAAEKGDEQLKATLEQKKDQARTEVFKYAANMNTVQAIVRARGSGKFWDQWRGWEDISVIADLIYVGVPDINAIAVSIEQEFKIDIPNLGGELLKA